MSIQHRAMRESIISTIIIYATTVKGIEIHKSDVDIRSKIGDALDDLIANSSTDETSWPYVKNTMLYDIYLEMREDEGTLTSLDLHRPGLSVAQFTDKAKYYEHQQRIVDHKDDFGDTSKICSVCEQEKPITKFKKKGGSVCNACRCRAYRKRKQDGKVNG